MKSEITLTFDKTLFIRTEKIEDTEGENTHIHTHVRTRTYE